jgi:hypothetical protein
MTRKQVAVAGAALTFAAVAAAWQNSLAVMGWTEADASRVANSWLVDYGPDAPPPVYQIKPEVRKRLQAMNGPERAKVVTQLAQAAKAFVSTPAFAKAYDGWIATSRHAVDHGIKAQSDQEKAAAMSRPGAINDMVTQAAADVAKNFAKMPPETLKQIAPSDLKRLTANPRTPEQQKIAAKANAIAPLLQSNPTEFAKQYGILKSMEMGGPDTLEGIEAAGAGAARAQADSKMQEEQRAYDEHKLKVELKRRLQNFVTLARTVDFAAQTQAKGGRQVFVNPAHENKPANWKMLFRLGKEPTLAAVAAADAWLKEL